MEDSTTQMKNAIQAWQQALPDTGQVSQDPHILQRYARSTQAQGTTPAAILYPHSTAEVQQICTIANQHLIPLYPIACGKNWGYTDACAPANNMVIVDCSQMNQIHEIHPTLGYAVIEPGVTQQQLYEAIQAQAPKFWMDATGAGPNASVVGNALERGFGHTPYGDHVQSNAGMEVVLPDGTCTATGFQDLPNSTVAHLYPYSIGPMLDGLFSQSNLGIVTRMTLWLYPKPEAFTFFYIRLDDESRLPQLIDTLQHLRLQDVLTSTVHLGNDLRLLSSHAPYPHDVAPPGTAIPKETRQQLRNEHGIGAWSVSGSISGTQGQVRANTKTLRNAIQGLGKLVLVNDQKIALAEKLLPMLQPFSFAKKLKRQLNTLKPNYGLLKGIPTSEPLQGTTWTLPDRPETCTDPHDAHAGFMWISPVLPAQGKHVTQVLQTLEPIFNQHGFDMLCSFTLINGRAIVSIINMLFDTRDTAQCTAASTCYDEAMRACVETGYPPYRCSPKGMQHLYPHAPQYWGLTQSIKNALDPNHILAPGRYIPNQD